MAYSSGQLRGALLEEAALFLLRASGYDPVTGPGVDPTLRIGPGGMEVRGRGTYHQIDAVADFKVSPPFANPQRLLLEAKYLAQKVGLDTIRNAAGVLRDVSEGWTVTPRHLGAVPRSRFHYLYTVFSASEFSIPAQDYAFAHDIFLMPLRRSTFLLPLLRAIDAVSAENVNGRLRLSVVRAWLRHRLLGTEVPQVDALLPDAIGHSLDVVSERCRELRFGFITMFGGQFPAFLVAAPDFDLEEHAEVMTVRIRCRGGSWYVESLDGRRILSFDLPEKIFELYEENGRIGRHAAANIKNDLMRSFVAFYRMNEDVRLLQFRLDRDWFDSVRAELG